MWWIVGGHSGPQPLLRWSLILSAPIQVWALGSPYCSLGLGRPLLAYLPALPQPLTSCPRAQSFCPAPPVTLSALLSAFLPLPPGLSKTSDQAYIEFESIEAIVKTASRTKFFIEFYSTCLEGQRRGPRAGCGPRGMGGQRCPEQSAP